MRRPSSNPFRRRRIDRRFADEIAHGPLWGYVPGPRARHVDTLGSIVEQHWDAVVRNRPGAMLGLATSLGAVSATEPGPETASLLDDVDHVASLVTSSPTAIGSVERLLVDGRCLQHPDFANRGIGRLAQAIIKSLETAAPDIECVIVTDDALPPIASPAISTDRMISNAELDDARGLRTLGNLGILDPAPMTHRPSALDRLPARRIAVIHDFVPLHAPNLYLPRSIDQLDYLVRLARLRAHDRFWCNSGAIAAESSPLLDVSGDMIGVLPPPPPIVTEAATRPDGIVEPFVFAPVGADRRKNLPCAVSTLAHRAHRGWPGHLVILSHMPDAHRLELNQLAEASGLDHDRILVVSDLSDAEIVWLFENADVSVIPSFDEGLSLPLLESIDAGCPVVASDIPPHRELLGDGERLCDPQRPSEFADQIEVILADRERALHRQRTAIGQARQRRSFDDVVGLLRR